MQLDPQAYIEIGVQLLNLGRWLQRTYLPVTNFGGDQGEDLILRDLLPDGPGTYVDIGAAHPIECSNTWQFYQRGWRGLLIEPLPEFWHAMMKFRPGDCFWPQAVSNAAGFANLRVLRTCSSLSPNWNIEEQGKIIVETDTAANILAQFPAIRDACRLCSIDVEGHERQVIEGIDWATFHPEVLVVEWVIYGEAAPRNDNSPEWLPLLQAQGYEVHARTACNLILKRRK